MEDYVIAQDPNVSEIYLYRNMTLTGGLLTLGEGANKLGIRSKEVEGKMGIDYVYPSSLQGLSTTLGIGNVIPQVPFSNLPKTTLFRINIKSLPACSLLPVLINGNYSIIIPAYWMNVQEFDIRIKSTAPLWKLVR